MKIGRGVRQAFCLSQIVFKLCSEYLNKDALEEFGDLGEQVIRTVNCADDLFLLVTEETVLSES
jgi:hypothetical protein